jgi:hypothetical protein
MLFPYRMEFSKWIKQWVGSYAVGLIFSQYLFSIEIY